MKAAKAAKGPKPAWRLPMQVTSKDCPKLKGQGTIALLFSFKHFYLKSA